MTPAISEALIDLKGAREPACQVVHDEIVRYLASGNVEDAVMVSFKGSDWEMNPLMLALVEGFPHDEDVVAIVSMVLLNLGKHKTEHPLVERVLRMLMGSGSKTDEFFLHLRRLADELGVPESELAAAAGSLTNRDLPFGWKPVTGGDVIQRSFWSSDDHRAIPDSLQGDDPLEIYFLGLDDETLGQVVARNMKTDRGLQQVPGTLIASLAMHRPQVIGLWLEKAVKGEHGSNPRTWSLIVRGTDRFDREMIEASLKLPPTERLRLLIHLGRLGRPADPQILREAALHKDQTDQNEALLFLAERFPDEFITRFSSLHREGKLAQGYGVSVSFPVFAHAARRWQSDGATLFQVLLEIPFDQLSHGHRAYSSQASVLRNALDGLLTELPGVGFEPCRKWLFDALDYLQKGKARSSEKSEGKVNMWTTVVGHAPEPFREEIKNLVGDKSKLLRAVAVSALKEQSESRLIEDMIARLGSGKVDQRLGLAELLEAVGDASHLKFLMQALEDEGSDRVRGALHQAIEASGGSTAETEEATEQSWDELEAEIARQAKKTKLPKSTWLALEDLPALFHRDGSELSPEVLTFLIAKQSKLKLIEAAPDVVPLIAWIDRERSADFALALVKGFLDSDQVAADRWALTLGGMLGDQRIIPPLLSRIQGWCENSRHKLAEYAAQAISLLPGDEPLMILDTLATRYRSKFKNVGKACSAAFEAAAIARGITPDELGDMVVPSFDFDEEGTRRFEWDGGGISAELMPDFKLQWFDPETDKSWKSMPASVPAETKAEVKLLNKMIRETVKGQTARLELSLVRQRSWPLARWRELYEEHPVLKSFASRLVWGIYDESGSLLRTFRRYPNGLLADAAGELEELPEKSVQIGMIHPLELETAALDAWRAHLSRMKVKSPFSQLDRPVELLDPLHGNRRELTITRGKEVGAGTFRSRSDKRGWVRGSVIDAGGISSIYKPFPGAGIEVVLPTNNFWIGIDPMDTVELESAYFVKSESIDRGSYIYDEPGPDDERVLRFDQVPAIVYSETLADLRMIVGEAAK